MSDGRGSSPGVPKSGTAERDDKSSPRIVVRTPAGHGDSDHGDSQMIGAADTAMGSPEHASVPTAVGPGGPSGRTQTADALVGEVLAGRYEITRKIGQGGMGVVYEAKHVHIGKRVAVKVLLDKYAEKDEVVRRLEQEARLASSIGHENIIDITDSGETVDGRMFVVMEFLEGESLGECIHRDGPLPEQRAIRIAHQIANALHAAHEKGIIHRDIKPENIFLLSRKGGDFVKVVDFGISKSLRAGDGDEAGSPRLTQTGMVLGTPLYMSPEQARGADELDRRIDVYALGVILYEMITGEVPFRGNNYLHIISQVINDQPRLPGELRPDLGSDLEEIILRALEKEPANRYQSCEEMAAELAALIEDAGRTTSGNRISGWRTRRTRYRRSGLRILGWVAGVAVVIGAVVITVGSLMSSGTKTVIIQQPVLPPPPIDAGAARVVADASVPTVPIARIRIVSNPPGATIYAGGRKLGVAPFDYETPKENRKVELVAELDKHDDTVFEINPFMDDGKEVPLRLEKPKRGQTRKVIKKTQDNKRPGSDRDEPAPGGSDGGKQGAAGGELGGNPYKRPGGK